MIAMAQAVAARPQTMAQLDRQQLEPPGQPTRRAALRAGERRREACPGAPWGRSPSRKPHSPAPVPWNRQWRDGLPARGDWVQPATRAGRGCRAANQRSQERFFQSGELPLRQRFKQHFPRRQGYHPAQHTELAPGAGRLQENQPRPPLASTMVSPAWAASISREKRVPMATESSNLK